MAPISSAARRSTPFIPSEALRRRVASLLPLLAKRQDNNGGQGDPTLGIYIPTTYVQTSNALAPGAVAGIVLGSVLGFLAVLGIIVWATTLNQNTFGTVDEVIEVHERRPPPRRRRRTRDDDSFVETVRVSHRPSRNHSPRRPSRTEIVEERIVEERIPIPRSRGPSPGPPPPPPPPMMEEVFVERRPARRSREEEVVVEFDDSEMSSLPDRRRSRRRSSGYRTVDPDRYAGGNYPRRPMRRRDSRALSANSNTRSRRY